MPKLPQGGSPIKVGKPGSGLSLGKPFKTAPSAPAPQVAARPSMGAASNDDAVLHTADLWLIGSDGQRYTVSLPFETPVRCLLEGVAIREGGP